MCFIYNTCEFLNWWPFVFKFTCFYFFLLMLFIASRFDFELSHFQLHEKWKFECAKTINRPSICKLQLIGHFVGFDTTTHIATIHDCEVLILVLMIIYTKLTLIVVLVVEHVAIIAPRLGVFGCW
jgi:hypothetical protein